MKISVVIPLYNKENHIQRTIESALKQEMPADEILVIDDGSTDHSADIVRTIKDPLIRLIQQPNAGECAARNRGLEEARNILVALLDADDEWKPEFLTHIQRLYRNFPDCGIYATAYDVFINDEITHTPKHPLIPPEPWIGILPNYFKVIQTQLPFNSSSVAIIKDHCLSVGGFPEKVKRGGDIMMWVRMAVRYPFAYSPSHQVIYHTEAQNRACDTFASPQDPALLEEIHRMIRSDQIPFDLIDDVREYYYKLNIRKAKDLLFLGDIHSAKSFLRNGKATKNYKTEYCFWRFWAGSLQNRFLPFVRNIKHKLF